MDELEPQQVVHAHSAHLRHIIDKLIIISAYAFIVVIASFIVYDAYGHSFPAIKMGVAALVTFLMTLIAIVFIVHYVRVAWDFVKLGEEKKDDDYFYFTMGAIALCLGLAWASVSSIVYSGELDRSQIILLSLEMLLFGFQLHRIIFRKTAHD